MGISRLWVRANQLTDKRGLAGAGHAHQQHSRVSLVARRQGQELVPELPCGGATRLNLAEEYFDDSGIKALCGLGFCPERSKALVPEQLVKLFDEPLRIGLVFGAKSLAGLPARLLFESFLSGWRNSTSQAFRPGFRFAVAT